MTVGKNRTVKESLSVEQKHVWCDAKAELIPARQCAIKHLTAVKKRERDVGQGKPSTLDACRCCPIGIEQLFLLGFAVSALTPADSGTNQTRPETKQEETVTKPKQESETPLGRPFMPGPCPSCGAERKIFRKKGVCQVCARKPRTKIKAKLDVKKVLRAKEAFEEAIDDHFEMKKCDQAKPELIDPSGRYTFFHFHLPNDVREKLETIADQQLRTPQNQALWILMEALR